MLKYVPNGHLSTFDYSNDDGSATAKILSLPHCEQVGYIYGSYVDQQRRGQGIGDKAHKDRIQLMKNALYDYSLATVDEANEPQIKIMKKNGWKRLDSFVNQCTEHTVIIFGKELK